MRYFFAYLLLLACIGCNQKKDLYHLPTLSENNNVQAVIEIPAGTNKKYEYNIETLQFEIDKRNGVDRIINFLPYPGNYGYIPATYSNPAEGGDGDALDVLVISEALAVGTIVEIVPIAMLKLIDNGEYDYKIIAIPQNESQRIIDATTYAGFIEHYPEAKEILNLWFTSYDKSDALIIEGWGNEKEALAEINKSLSSMN